MKHDVMTLDEAQVPAPAPIQAASESAAIFAMIERAAMNPAVDLDKMERLLQMQERVLERNARMAYAASLSAMQPELPVIEAHGGIKDRAGKVQSRYAKWEDINEQIKPVLAKHGFALSFRTGHEGDKIIVTGILSHRDGHAEETTMALPLDLSGSKNAVQGVGSSTSYGKRYTAGALLNLTSRAPEDQDDDGGAAAAGGTISADQYAELLRVAESVGANEADETRLLRFFKIQTLHELPATKLAEAIGLIKQRGARK
jgi:hypothetical protein